ncbi:MAG: Hsp20/alpha crystallin family protein [Acidobacteria bacterium]|nr:Hsp20/alpha crystallin family protein [Acidobacteriota bacterium]MCA1649287.1 Hsp20/alpha crystallin family protein [Acidobacteriota bacterium]
MARIYLERRTGGEDIRRLLAVLDEQGMVPGPAESSPPMDVIETATAIEILLDVPGVPIDAITVLVTRGTIVVAGQKKTGVCEHHGAAFHLAERSFGRFARVVRLTGAYDGGRARATLRNGELRVVLPRIEERRGRKLRIPVTTE